MQTEATNAIVTAIINALADAVYIRVDEKLKQAESVMPDHLDMEKLIRRFEDLESNLSDVKEKAQDAYDKADELDGKLDDVDLYDLSRIDVSELVTEEDIPSLVREALCSILPTLVIQEKKH